MSCFEQPAWKTSYGGHCVFYGRQLRALRQQRRQYHVVTEPSPTQSLPRISPDRQGQQIISTRNIQVDLHSRPVNQVPKGSFFLENVLLAIMFFGSLLTVVGIYFDQQNLIFKCPSIGTQNGGTIPYPGFHETSFREK